MRNERLEAAEALDARVDEGARLRGQLLRKHLVEVGENDDGGGRVLVAVEPDDVLAAGGRADGREKQGVYKRGEGKRQSKKGRTRKDEDGRNRATSDERQEGGNRGSSEK